MQWICKYFFNGWKEPCTGSNKAFIVQEEEANSPIEPVIAFHLIKYHQINFRLKSHQIA
jgi:hypothetical protein